VRIQKDNIVIRSATIDDAIQLNTWWNDGKVMEHAGFPNGLGETIEDTIDNIKNRKDKLNQLCIIEIDGKPVGELSYRIKADKAYPGWKICDFNYQNQGYGTKIIMILLEFLFTDGDINSTFSVNKIILDTMLENKRAQHVYEAKIGAKKIGLRENTWQDQVGNWRSAVDYEITREAFFDLFTNYQAENLNIINSNNPIT
jgi:RimJ/RimL family protein N-acetyltransferase